MHLWSQKDEERRQTVWLICIGSTGRKKLRRRRQIRRMRLVWKHACQYLSVPISISVLLSLSRSSCSNDSISLPHCLLVFYLSVLLSFCLSLSIPNPKQNPKIAQTLAVGQGGAKLMRLTLAHMDSFRRMRRLPAANNWSRGTSPGPPNWAIINVSRRNY